LKTQKPNSQKLTMKQDAFVQELQVDLNASAAARRAGYSVKNAGRIAGELMEKTHIIAAVAAAQAERSRRTQITADSVIAEVIRLGKVAEKAGQLAVAVRSLELVGKHLGLWTDRIETIGSPDHIILNYHRADRNVSEG
jgi:phage terminase small subunit